MTKPFKTVRVVLTRKRGKIVAQIEQGGILGENLLPKCSVSNLVSAKAVLQHIVGPLADTVEYEHQEGE